MTIHLSKRLQRISDFIPAGDRVADIGTDHAFIPIYLVQSGRSDFVVASDIGAGPVAIAQANVTTAGLTEQIAVRQADGLSGLTAADGIATVVIAGLGGQLMVQLLTAGHAQLDGSETLVLSPNRDAPLVRTWLAEHEYGILEEALVEDEGHVYPVIVAALTKPEVPYSRADLLLGPLLRQANGPLFQREVARAIRKTTTILTGLREAHDPDQAAIQAAEEALAIYQEAQDVNRR